MRHDYVEEAMTPDNTPTPRLTRLAEANKAAYAEAIERFRKAYQTSDPDELERLGYYGHRDGGCDE